MKSFITRDKTKKILKQLLAAVFWISVWYIAAAAVNKEVLVASPTRVAARIISLCGEELFRQSVLASVLRILIGFAAGVVFGSVLAFCGHFIKTVAALTSPAVAVIRATPVASFIILALVWLEKGDVPSFITFLMVLPIVWGNVGEGLRQTDTGLLEMARVFGVSPAGRLGKIYIPSVMPYFTTAVKTSLGLGWKAGIAAEVLCTPALSIGKELYEAKIYLETVDVFAWTAVIVILSFIIEKLVILLIDRLFSGEKGRRAKNAG